MPAPTKVFVKNHPNPKFRISDKLKVEYVQMAYDNRYIIVKQNTFGTMWVDIVKVADSSIGKAILESLVNNIGDIKKQKLGFNKLSKFWENIKVYDEILDNDAESDIEN